MKNHSLTRKPLSVRIRNELRRNWVLYLMVMPGLLLFFLFRYVPLYGIVMAFQNFDMVDGYFGSPWAGLTNFQNFFSDPYSWTLIKNTFILGLYTLLFSFPAPILFALFLNEMRDGKYKRTLQTISYLPHFIPVVVLVGIMYNLFGSSGTINMILQFFGIEAQGFFTDPKWFRFMYIISDIWQTVGWGSIIYMGALTSIDPTLYEAATIDGATRFQKIWKITLPCIAPTISMMFILQCGKVMKVAFDKVLLMYSPATYEVSDILSTYTYRRGIVGMDYSYGAAVDLFNNVLCLALVLLSNYFSKRVGEDGIL